MAAGVLATLLLSFLPGTALAGTDDYPPQWRNATQDSLLDTWRYYNRECTSFVAWRLHSRNGYEMPAAIGNAGQWGPWFSARGVAVNGTPAVGAIAESAGHVAWVEAVNGNQVTIEEYNYSYNGTYNERTVAASAFHYIHPKDIGSSAPQPLPGRRFIADVDGDGRSDLVIYNASDASWSVAQSSGSGFYPPKPWASGRRKGSTNQFVADVNGDGKADAVTFFAATGDWWAGASSGSGFWPETQWAAGHGAGSSNQFVADVNRDGRADEIVSWSNPGSWWVGASSGSGFWPETQWAYGPAYGG